MLDFSRHVSIRSCKLSKVVIARKSPARTTMFKGLNFHWSNDRKRARKSEPHACADVLQLRLSACDKNIYAPAREISSWTLKEKVRIYLHIPCIHFSNPQIVIALLFSCSMACQNCTLLSQERMDCREKNLIWKNLDAYIQIQCHGNGQSCNATCDGATSKNPNTSKFVGVKTQSKPAW